MDAAVARSPAHRLDAADASLSRAYKLLWLAVLFDILAFGVGFGWDRQWHATHPFEDFWSPPHIFVYTTHLFATLTLAYVAFTPDLRCWFGPTIRLWPFPFPVPGAIAIAGGGFVVTGLAGFFDSVWHTRFGLDETSWSFPHSMLGWGISVAFVGIAACRVAIARHRPIGWGSAAVFGFLLLSSSFEHVGGPIMGNLSPAVVRAIADVPILAREPAFQHTTHIYLDWDLTRQHSLFVPISAFAAGLALGLLRSFDPRPLTVIGLAALTSYLTSELGRSFGLGAGFLLGIPIVVPAIVISARGARPIGWRTWALAGLAYGVVAALLSGVVAATVWKTPSGATGAGALLAAPLCVVGARLATRIWSVVMAPTRRGVLAFVVLAGIVVPAFTGAIDLYLRAHTP